MTEASMQAAEVVDRLMQSAEDVQRPLRGGTHPSSPGRVIAPQGTPLMQHLIGCICARAPTGAVHHDTASLRQVVEHLHTARRQRASSVGCACVHQPPAGSCQRIGAACRLRHCLPAAAATQQSEAFLLRLQGFNACSGVRVWASPPCTNACNLLT